MNRKIEAYDKIIDLIKSGRRSRFFYKKYLIEPDQQSVAGCVSVECYCALGCLMRPDVIEIVSHTQQSCAVTFLPDAILDNLKSYGFTLEELENIQQLNDHTGDDQDFLNVIKKLKSEVV